MFAFSVTRRIYVLNGDDCFAQGLVEVLCEACEQMGWKSPSKIQREAIPVALQGKHAKTCRVILILIYLMK